MTGTVSEYRYRGKRYSDGFAEYAAPMRKVERTPFGERLVQARIHAGLSQEVLAQKAGMSQSTLAGAEKNGQGSRYTTRIAEACAVNSHWLATGEGRMELVVTSIGHSPSSGSATLTAGSAETGAAPPELPVSEAAEPLLAAIQMLSAAIDQAGPEAVKKLKPLFSMLLEAPGERAFDSGTIAHRLAELLVAAPISPARAQTKPRAIPGLGFEVPTGDEKNESGDNAARRTGAAGSG